MNVPEVSRASLWQSLFMPSLRVVPGDKALYLTFDDGSDTSSTPAVLDLLLKLEVRATFFLVAEKALANVELTRRIQAEGHAIGNHSLDHSYQVFFRGLGPMIEWIQKAEQVFKDLGISTVGFRPPAGVRTPELHRALMQIEMPLVMWQKRFYDTTIQWTRSRALKSLDSTPPGSIVLLHDRQSAKRLRGFLDTLEFYIRAARERGLDFRSLTAVGNHPKVAARKLASLNKEL